MQLRSDLALPEPMFVPRGPFHSFGINVVFGHWHQGGSFGLSDSKETHQPVSISRLKKQVSATTSCQDTLGIGPRSRKAMCEEFDQKQVLLALAPPCIAIKIFCLKTSDNMDIDIYIYVYVYTI